MAFGAASVFEIRATATGGANVNGGGFNPSNAGGNTTDYSQQDGAQYGFANLASTNGTTNPSVVTSASHNFVAADVGNFLKINAGTNWTVGWYEIVSVAGNAATLDRAVGTAANISSGTFNVGGAITLGGTGTSSDAIFFNSATAGNKFWIKNGSYALGASTTITTAGTNSAPIIIEGYNANRNDKPLTSNRPAFSNVAATWTFGTFWNVRYLDISSTASTQTVTIGADGTARNCKFNMTSATATRFAYRAGVRSMAVNCEMLSSSATDGAAIAHSAAGTAMFIGCYIHDSVLLATLSGANVASIWNNCIFKTPSSKGLTIATSTVGHLVTNSTFYGAETPAGTAVDLGTGVASVRLINNIIYGFTTGVTHADSQANSFDEFNDYFNNTTDVTNWTKGSSDLALNPNFVNAAGADWTPGGNLKNVGYPGLIVGTSSTSYADVGAVQTIGNTYAKSRVVNA